MRVRTQLNLFSLKFGDEEGGAILRLGACFSLTAGVPGGNLGFWIRR
jgi:hypothetical protein